MNTRKKKNNNKLLYKINSFNTTNLKKLNKLYTR